MFGATVAVISGIPTRCLCGASSREGTPPVGDPALRSYTAVNPNTFGKLNESCKGFCKISPGYSRRFGEGLPGTDLEGAPQVIVR